jgi:hypothetical protein
MLLGCGCGVCVGASEIEAAELPESVSGCSQAEIVSPLVLDRSRVEEARGASARTVAQVSTASCVATLPRQVLQGSCGVALPADRFS